MRYLLAFVGFLVVSLASLLHAADRPNVLFIYLDDFGWRDCGFMGTDFYETPNLDALAASGMVFTNAYSCAANCAPARACLLSGQYTPRHEVYNVGTGRRGKAKYGSLKHIPGVDVLSPDIRTWAAQIHDAGYRTATIGKWHLSDDPIPYGFDFNFAGTHGGSPPKGYFPPHPKAPGLEDAPEDEYLTDRLTDEAIGFIDRNQDANWLLYLTHFAVHTPLQGQPDLVAKYEAKPKGDLHDHAVMAAMIESVDRGIGRIVRQLDSLGLREKTAIVFTSDNGGYGPATSMAPLQGYKGTYFEGGIREPFFVVWPGNVKPGTKCETPVIQVDLYPTLCEMTGASLPTGQVQDGRSLVPLLVGSDAWKERAIFWHFPAYLDSYSRIDGQRDPIYRSRPCSIIRRGDWKLHEYFEDGKLLLFNLKDDIGESNDVSIANADVTKAMHDELLAWREATGAPVPIEPNPKYDAAAESRAMKGKKKK
ncbi:sulfatase [Rubripirellula tenax]|nr:sulfatase [Rubripirellula tenax]